MKKTFTLSLLVALSLLVNAQKTVTLQPGAEGKDATLYWIDGVDGRNGDMMNKNYGNSTAILGEAWTVDGYFFIARSLFEFDYSVIPAGSKIISAKLSLFYEGIYEHSSLSGSNELVIQRVTSPWEENSVSWICDTCAYLSGMLLGKHKLAPVLSPKKSVEGAIGGIVGSALVGALYG